jgi:hypothetical protein
MRSIALILMTLLTGCASINSVSLTSIPARKGKEIKVERSKFIVFGFNFNNDFVDEMVEALKAECPNGQVKGILTKDETIDYFIMLFITRRVTATGYCQTGELAQVSERM